jgi:RHS repeat-associated protein
LYNNITTGFTGSIGSSGSSTVPSAFLTYILYDKTFTRRITWGTKGVTSAGNMAKEQLTITPQLDITEPGYLYVCLYNRSDNVNPVYFDDFVVSVQHSAIVAGADYYPFGMVQNTREITREDYRYGYQGQYAEKDTTNNWSQFELRFYDAKIARWLSADPFREFYSPYVGMGNKPNLATDPTGGFTGGGTVAMTTINLADVIVITASRLPSVASVAGSIAGSVGTSLLSNAITAGPLHNYIRQADGSLRLVELTNDDFDNVLERDGEVTTYLRTVEIQSTMLDGGPIGESIRRARAPIGRVFTEALLSAIPISKVALLHKAYRATKATKGGTQAVEGIYEFTAASGKTYVGQSRNIPARLEQHIASGKLLPGTSVKTTEVLGGKTAREIAEQLRINSLGGIKYLENIRNPIGSTRRYLLPKTP